MDRLRRQLWTGYGFGCDLVVVRVSVSNICRTPGEGSHPYICVDIDFDHNLVSASVVTRYRLRLLIGSGFGRGSARPGLGLSLGLGFGCGLLWAECAPSGFGDWPDCALTVLQSCIFRIFLCVFFVFFSAVWESHLWCRTFFVSTLPLLLSHSFLLTWVWSMGFGHGPCP